MKFPFWLLPIIISTIAIVVMQGRKSDKETEKLDRKMFTILTILGLIGLLASIGLFIYL